MKVFLVFLLALSLLTELFTGQLDAPIYPELAIKETDQPGISWQNRLENQSSRLDSIRSFRLAFSNLTDLTAYLMDRLPKLEILSLDSNKIESIASNAFGNTKFVRRISFKSNRLQNLDSFFKAIIDESSSLATSLEFLDLSGNSITDLPFFPRMVRLSELNLAKNQLSTLDGRVFRGLTSLKLLNLEENTIKTIEPDSFSYFGASGHKLSVLLCSNSLTDFTAVMSGLRDVPFDLLDLCRNPIKTLSPLESWFKVTKLRMALNGLASLGLEPLFPKNIYLREIELMYNGIEVIETGVFSGLKFPLELILSHNSLSSTAIAGLNGTAISKLDLTRCGIDVLKPFPRMDALRILILSYNEIETLAPHLFDNLPSLKEIWLNNNWLEDIEPGVFTIKNNLNKLIVNLGSNHMANVNRLIKGLANEPIEELRLSRFYKFGLDFFPSMPHLKTLDLSGNPLKQYGFFKNATNLERILLGDCMLSNFTSDFLYSIKKVNFISLELNFLSNVPNLSYFNGSALKTLDLAGQNQVLKIDDYAFQRAPGSLSGYIQPLEVNISSFIPPNIMSFNTPPKTLQFSPKAFCSNYSDRILISKLQINLNSFKQMNKCHLKQLRGSEDSSVEVEIIFEGEYTPDLDANAAEYCGCGQTRLFAMKYNVKLIGFCLQYPNVSCTYDPALVQDDCDQQSEYACSVNKNFTPAVKATMTFSSINTTNTTKSASSTTKILTAETESQTEKSTDYSETTSTRKSTISNTRTRKSSTISTSESTSAISATTTPSTTPIKNTKASKTTKTRTSTTISSTFITTTTSSATTSTATTSTTTISTTRTTKTRKTKNSTSTTSTSTTATTSKTTTTPKKTVLTTPTKASVTKLATKATAETKTSTNALNSTATALASLPILVIFLSLILARFQ